MTQPRHDASAGAAPRRSTRLDPYVERYASRTSAMKASEIRALFSVASRPEVVSLAGGMPNLAALPIDAVADTMTDLVLRRGTVALQYGSGQGDPTLRSQICEIMALECISASPEDVVVTVGSQQAVDLVTRVFCDPGDVVLCESPSYVGALGVFRGFQCDVLHVHTDAEGLVPEALEAALTAAQTAGRTVKLLYTVPTYSNPAGVTLSTIRRSQVLEICRRFGILVLEDNPYGLLGFDGSTYAALRAADAESVVYLGTFSKTFAPGLRVGWALAPHAVREKLVLAQESATLCPPTFSQLAVSAYLHHIDWRSTLKSFVEMYRERRDATLSALDTSLSGRGHWTIPAGGFYVWLTLPEGLDTKAMLPRAVTERVAYVPGTAFFADGSGSRSLRLSYCYPPPERIREGVRRLAGVVEAELELLETFGTPPPAPGGGYAGPGPGLG